VEILFYESHDVYVHGLPQALEALGHHVTVWEGTPSHERLARYLAANRPELVLSMGWTPMHGDTVCLERLRSYCAATGALHVYWATEDPLHTSVWTLLYLEQSGVDAVVTISPKALPFLRSLGYAAEELPFGAHPPARRPFPGGAPADVVLVGTAYPEFSGQLRSAGLRWLLRPLLSLDCRVAVYGRFWDSAGRSLGFDLPPEWLRPQIPYPDVPRVYASAALVLCPQNEANQLTGRTFEALAVGGGTLLTLRTPGVLRWFAEGRHVLCTSSEAETTELVRRWLPDAAGRAQLSASGQAEVLEHHTYQARAKQLLGWVEGWLQEKRRLGHVCPPRPPSLGIVRPDAVDATGPLGQDLRLCFTPPAAPAGLELRSARLRCFAEEVAQPGDAVCLQMPSRMVLDARHVASPTARPYPYEFGWHEWDVLQGLDGRPGSPLELELRATQDLRVEWCRPEHRPGIWTVLYNKRAFLPQLWLRWAEPGRPD